LSRNLGHLMLLMEEFARYQVQLRFVNAPDDGSPESRMLLQLRGAFSEYERSKITERTRRGKEGTIRNGKIMGSRFVAFGYRYTDNYQTFEICPEEAVSVEKIFTWIVEDHLKIRAVAQRLNEAHVPTKQGGAKWTCGTVHSILKNPVYKGEWT